MSQEDELQFQFSTQDDGFYDDVITQSSQQHYSQDFSSFTAATQDDDEVEASQDVDDVPVGSFPTFPGDPLESDVSPPNLSFADVHEDDEGLDDDEEEAAEVAAAAARQRRREMFSCFYCGCPSENSLVKCQCGKWFCNGRGLSCGSHIVQHLVKSKHKAITLHPNSPLGDTVLECYVCGSRNVFLLGFVTSKKDSVVVLLCRDPCLHHHNLEEMNWNTAQWLPLISDRQFLHWLVRVPSPEEQERCRHVSTPMIGKIEDMLKVNSGVTMDDLDKPTGRADELTPIPFSFEDGYRYKILFAPLIEAEANYDKDMKESQTMESVVVEWHFPVVLRTTTPGGGGGAGGGADDMDTAGGGGGGGRNSKKRSRRKKKRSVLRISNTRRQFSFSCPKDEAGFRLVPGDEIALLLSQAYMRIKKQELDDRKAMAAVQTVVAAAAAASSAASGGSGAPDPLQLDRDDEDVAAEQVQKEMDRIGLRWLSKICDRGDWKGVGHVVKLDGERVICELSNRTSRFVPIAVKAGFKIEFVWKSTSYDRLQHGLGSIATNERCVSMFLYHKLLGHQVGEQKSNTTFPKEYSAPNLPNLNHSQIAAVKHALTNPLTLIQGPPGTGKTITAATLCSHLVHIHKGDQILVSAPSNVAVDQLAEKIHEIGLKVVRLCAKSREGVDSSVEFLTLHHTVNLVEGNPVLASLRRKQQLSSREAKRYRAEVKRTEREILRMADVVCCTCVGAGDPRLNRMVFKRVIIDESTQATEPECLLPIVKGARQVILIGDHCQLGPVIMCKNAAVAGLNRSLFERLVMLGNRPLRLQVQYRMHPCLSEFPSNTFYEGTLQNGVTMSERVITNIVFPWPVPSKPMFFYHCLGEEEFSSSGTSYLNRIEAHLVEKVVTCLLKGGVIPHQLGVVTPYEGQRSYLVRHMQRSGSLRSELYEAIEVASVDSFQGREKDFIILSAVRSNMHHGIGFLNNPRRLNVALSRARCGLVVVGNAKVLARHPLWNLLINHFKKNDLVVEGPLNHLKQCTLMFPKPRRHVRQQQRMGGGFGYGLVQSVPFSHAPDQVPYFRHNAPSSGSASSSGGGGPSAGGPAGPAGAPSATSSSRVDYAPRPSIPFGYHPGASSSAPYHAFEDQPQHRGAPVGDLYGGVLSQDGSMHMMQMPASQGSELMSQEPMTQTQGGASQSQMMDSQFSQSQPFSQSQLTQSQPDDVDLSQGDFY